MRSALKRVLNDAENIPRDARPADDTPHDGELFDAYSKAVARAAETVISAADSQVKIFVIPTNEELVVARETKRLLEAKKNHHPHQL